MKSFDTKDSNDSKVSSRKFESFHRKHSELEESPKDFSEVSSRKIPNLNAHLMEFVKFPVKTVKVQIRKILMILNFAIQTLKVPIRKTQRLMGDLDQELINKLMPTRRFSAKDILLIGNFMNWIHGYDTFNHWYCQSGKNQNRGFQS